MSVSVQQIIVGNFAYGNPASLGEPLGLWAGEANVTGDGTGGHVQVGFEPQNPTATPTLPDQRREYIYFVDGIGFASNGEPGLITAHIPMHMARSNVALARRFHWHKSTTSANQGNGTFVPTEDLVGAHTSRMPVFWDTQELASSNDIIVEIFASINTNAVVYRYRCYGRYYDRQLLANRSFGRLVAPPPVAPFG